MKQKLTEHYVFSPASGQVQLFSNALMADYLLPWATTEPDLKRVEITGPTWQYEFDGKSRQTTVPMTVYDWQGKKGYWDMVDSRVKAPLSVAVKRSRAAEEGTSYRLFDTLFIEANLVEHRNRSSAFYLLNNARDWDSVVVETDILMAVVDGPKTVAALSAVAGHSTHRVKVAAIRLWKRSLVGLPIKTHLLGDRWLVSGGGHGCK